MIKRKMIAVLATVTLLASTMTGCASIGREIKNFESEITGGLERTVKAYGPDGKLVGEWSGEIDIQTNDYGNKVLFDLDGKRIVLYNATVIVEEI